MLLVIWPAPTSPTWSTCLLKAWIAAAPWRPRRRRPPHIGPPTCPLSMALLAEHQRYVDDADAFRGGELRSVVQVSGEQDDAMAITEPRASTSSRPERSITSWICLSFATMTKTTSAFLHRIGHRGADAHAVSFGPFRRLGADVIARHTRSRCEPCAGIFAEPHGAEPDHAGALYAVLCQFQPRSFSSCETPARQAGLTFSPHGLGYAHNLPLGKLAMFGVSTAFHSLAPKGRGWGEGVTMIPYRTRRSPLIPTFSPTGRRSERHCVPEDAT